MCSPSTPRRCRVSRATPGLGREAETSPRAPRARATGSLPWGPPSTWTTSRRRTAVSTSWRRRTRSDDPARVSASMSSILRGKEIIFICDLAANNRDVAASCWLKAYTMSRKEIELFLFGMGAIVLQWAFGCVVVFWWHCEKISRLSEFQLE